MKKQIIFLGLLCSGLASSQVGINTLSPKATLDIAAKTTNGTQPEGVIAPRLTGDQIKAADNIYTSAQEGIIIYATSAVTSITAGSKTENITAAGYYFFSGSKWQKLGGGAGSNYVGSTSVALNGNSIERAALTGDVTAAANSNNVTVTKVQGFPFAAVTPIAGQQLIYNGTEWTPNAKTIPAEITSSSGTYTVKATDVFLLINANDQNNLPFVNLPSTGIPLGHTIFLSNKGAAQVNFKWDNAIPPGSLFYNEQDPSFIPPNGYGILVFLGTGSPGGGKWSFHVWQ